MCGYRATFEHVWLQGGMFICVAVGRHLYMCGYREALVYVWL